MTVSSLSLEATAATNGATTAFPFSFAVLQASDLVVLLTVTATGAVSTLRYGVDYSVTLASVGGTVTTMATYAAGFTVTVRRSVPLTQEADLTNGGGWYPDVIEAALDKAAMIAQQQQVAIADVTARSLLSPTAVGALPSKVDRASKVLGFDANGDPLAVLPSAAPVSAAMQPIVAAATTGAALASMGYVGKNFLHNAAMWVNQRGEAQTIAAGANVKFPVDRWSVRTGAGNTAVGTCGQNGLVSFSGNGVTQSVGLSLSTAQASMAASDNITIAQTLEGVDAARLVGVDFTVSAWVYVQAAGTYGLRIGTYDRSYVVSKTLAAGWQKVSFTVTGGIPTGVIEVGHALSVQVCVACGVGYQTSTLNAWQTGVYLGPTGQTNGAATTGTVFAISAVQIEIGTQATAFVARPYAQELAICQRYFQRLAGGNSVYASATGSADSASTATLLWRFPVPMRAAPTASLIALGEIVRPGVAWYSVSAAIVATSPHGAHMSLSLGSSPLAAGQATLWRGCAYDFSAEI